MQSSLLNSKSSGLIRDFTTALGQQFYFWGCDIVQPSGNMLEEFGFKRHRSQGKRNASSYKMNFKGRVIELNSFSIGSYSANRPSFLFTRYPRRCWLYNGKQPSEPGVFDKSLMSLGPIEKIEVAIQKFLEWWLAYESWVSSKKSKAYREHCYRSFKKIPGSKNWLPPEKALSWLKAYKSSQANAKRAREWKSLEAIDRGLQSR